MIHVCVPEAPTSRGGSRMGSKKEWGEDPGPALLVLSPSSLEHPRPRPGILNPNLASQIVMKVCLPKKENRAYLIKSYSPDF